jgi:hypothetical protein
MADVTITRETTSAITYSATAATMITNITNALVALPSVTIGDVVVTNVAANQYRIEWQGAYQKREMSPFTATASLNDDKKIEFPTTAADANVGDAFSAPPANAVFYLRIQDDVISGSFTLTTHFTQGKRLENRMAMQWIRSIILGDAVLAQVLNRNLVWFDRFPYGDVYDTNSVPSIAILIGLDSNHYYRTLGGSEPYLANHTIRCSVIASRDVRTSILTDSVAQRLRELFRYRINATTPGGLILSCAPVRQLNTPEQLADRWAIHLGIVLSVSVQQSYP